MEPVSKEQVKKVETVGNALVYILNFLIWIAKFSLITVVVVLLAAAFLHTADLFQILDNARGNLELLQQRYQR